MTGANSIYLGPVQTTTYTLTASAGSSSVTQQDCDGRRYPGSRFRQRPDLLCKSIWK